MCASCKVSILNLMRESASAREIYSDVAGINSLHQHQPSLSIALSISRNQSQAPTSPTASHSDGLASRAFDFWVRKSWMLWVLAAVVLLLDQSTKTFIVGWLSWGESWPVEGFFRFTHARNTGTAFSLFQGHSNILSFVAIIAVGILLWVYWSTGAKSFILRIALGLQLGGALGNLLDRLQQGYVTDFIDVGPWPIFNVADSAISIGMVLMLWYFFTNRDEETTEIAVVKTASAPNVVPGRCQRCADATQYSNPQQFDSDVPNPQIRS